MTLLQAYTVVFVILIFVLIEMYHDRKEQKSLYQGKDTKNNFLIGVLVIIVNSNSRLLFYACMFLMHKVRFFTLENTVLTWTLCILAADFSYYVYHRVCHGVNWFWVSHSVHHSSEHLNLSTSFRLSITNNLSGHFIFWLWMPLLGFDPLMSLTAHFIVHAYQSWLHTELIGKLPALIEYLFNTPSHHRVHHGSNPEYIDKNHGGILIIWDRLFNSFCEEYVKPIYGLSNHPELNGPKDILFKDWITLFRSCKAQKGFSNRMRILFAKPSGEVFGEMNS